MDLADISINVLNLWSIIIILIMIGPPIAVYSISALQGDLRLKNIILVCLEMYIVLQIIVIAFGEAIPFENYTVMLAVIFSMSVAIMSWPKIKPLMQGREVAQVIMNWVIFLTFSIIFLHYHYIDLWLIMSRGVYWMVAAFNFVAVLVVRLVYKLSAKEIGAVFSVLQVLLPVIYDGDILRQIRSKKTHKVISFLVELSVVIFILRWMFHQHILSESMLLIECVALVTSIFCWYFWASVDVKTKNKLKVAIWLMIFVGVIILICQLIWDVHFMMAVRMFIFKIIVPFSLAFKQVAGRVLIKVVAMTKTFWGKAVFFVAGFSWLKFRAIGGWIVRQFSKRALIKGIIGAVVLQVFASKKMRNAKAEKIAKLKNNLRRGKDRWKSISYWNRLLVSLVGTMVFMVVLATFHIPIDMLFTYVFVPSGTGAKLAGAGMKIAQGIRWVFGLLAKLAKKLWLNKTTDFVMALFAKTIVGRLSNRLQHRLYMFRKWRLGRFALQNNETFHWVNKKARDKLRQARRLEIAKRKAVFATAKNLGNVVANGVLRTGKAVLARGTALKNSTS